MSLKTFKARTSPSWVNQAQLRARRGLVTGAQGLGASTTRKSGLYRVYIEFNKGSTIEAVEGLQVCYSKRFRHSGE